MSIKITQQQYKFLENKPMPRILRTAFEKYGTQEIVGPKHNPVILKWAKDLGLSKVYTNDEIPWCGLFVAIVVKDADYANQVVKDPLWARNWAKYGTGTKTGALGDILVFGRNGGGHVGFYVGEDATCFHVLGGNQSNRVNVTRILKTRLIAIRRTKWSVAQPNTVVRLVYNANGTISQNEA